MNTRQLESLNGIKQKKNDITIYRAASQNTKILAKFLFSFYGSKHVSIKIGDRAEETNFSIL